MLRVLSPQCWYGLTLGALDVTAPPIIAPPHHWLSPHQTLQLIEIPR